MTGGFETVLALSPADEFVIVAETTTSLDEIEPVSVVTNVTEVNDVAADLFAEDAGDDPAADPIDSDVASSADAPTDTVDITETVSETFFEPTNDAGNIDETILDDGSTEVDLVTTVPEPVVAVEIEVAADSTNGTEIAAPVVSPIVEVINYLVGGNGKDTLQGDAGQDIIDAGNGKDILSGGGGADELTGGKSSDTFLYNAASDSGVGEALRDVIIDFDAGKGSDVISLQGFTVGGFDFLGSETEAFTGSGNNVEVRFNDSSKVLEIDTDGDAAADMEIELAAVSISYLDNSDFAAT